MPGNTMNTLLPLLMWRYMRGARDERSVTTMIKLCFASILIGAASLALVMAIMNGFEKVTQDKMQGIHAQIIMRIPAQADEYETVSKALSAEFPEIIAHSPQDMVQVIIQNPAEKSFETVILKAIDPEKEAHTSTLESKIIQTIPELSAPKTLVHTLTDNHILIGAKLAQRLGVQPGDTLQLLFHAGGRVSSAHITLRPDTAVIGGIFSAGIEEFDAGVLFCSFSLLKKLFPDALPTQISLTIAPQADEQTIVKKLRTRFATYEVFSWKELYPELMAALVLEKYAMFFILSLIMLVACMNVVSLLFMHITQKRGDIAIMKAMGMSDTQITHLFVWLGMSISLLATLAGLALACVASCILERYPFIKLPDVYYVSHLPARMEIGLLIQVFVVIMLISIVATWLPAQKTRAINIADVLRFEA